MEDRLLRLLRIGKYERADVDPRHSLIGGAHGFKRPDEEASFVSKASTTTTGNNESSTAACVTGHSESSVRKNEPSSGFSFNTKALLSGSGSTTSATAAKPPLPPTKEGVPFLDRRAPPPQATNPVKESSGVEVPSTSSSTDRGGANNQETHLSEAQLPQSSVTNTPLKRIVTFSESPKAEEPQDAGAGREEKKEQQVGQEDNEQAARKKVEATRR